jgi:hypothetical protein
MERVYYVYSFKKKCHYVANDGKYFDAWKPKARQHTDCKTLSFKFCPPICDKIFLCVYGRKIEAQTTDVCCDIATVPHDICSRHNKTSGTELKSVGYMMTLSKANSSNVRHE